MREKVENFSVRFIYNMFIMVCQSKRECNSVPVGPLDQHLLYLDKHINPSRSGEEHVILLRDNQAMISHLYYFIGGKKKK